MHVLGRGIWWHYKNTIWMWKNQISGGEVASRKDSLSAEQDQKWRKKAYRDGEEAAIALDNSRAQLEKPVYNQKERLWWTLPAALPKSSQGDNLAQGLNTGPLIWMQGLAPPLQWVAPIPRLAEVCILWCSAVCQFDWYVYSIYNSCLQVTKPLKGKARS